MKTVKSILEKKGSSAWTVAPDAPLSSILKILAEKNIGAVLVGQDGGVHGIVSERDIARNLLKSGTCAPEMPAKELMTKKVLYVLPDQTIEDCMALMTDKHIRHLPVLEDGKLAGVISIGDVVKAMIEEREFVIQQLEHYIKGR